MPVQGRNWYVIFCKPHQEKQVCASLTDKGCEVYYPTCIVRTDPLRPPKEQSFFPRYLFVRAAAESVGISVFNWIPGAIGLLKYGDAPAIVPDQVIDQLKERISMSAAAYERRGCPYKNGERVRIVGGPFAGYEAIFDLSLRGIERVRVLIKMLNRPVTVDLNVNAIEKFPTPR